jgi:competence protein ComEC
MIQSYATAHFCQLKSIDSLKNNYFFNNYKTLIIDQSSIYKTSISADIIILRQSPKVNLERLLFTMKPKVIIADASNYKSYVSAWKETCRKEKIPFHSTYEKGFYKL